MHRFFLMLFCASIGNSFRFTPFKLLRMRQLQCSASLDPSQPPKGVRPAALLDQLPSPVTSMEFRVGKVIEVAPHPSLDSLYVNQVDVGEPTGARTVVAGLAKFISKEALINSSVVIFCNLKPRNFMNVTSNGMVLCCSDANHTKVAPIVPPIDAKVGELVTFPGILSDPLPAGNKVVKLWSKVQQDLKVDDNGVATFQGVPFTTTAGNVTGSVKGSIS